jgi:hypothetical protein
MSAPGLATTPHAGDRSTSVLPWAEGLLAGPMSSGGSARMSELAPAMSPERDDLAATAARRHHLDDRSRTDTAAEPGPSRFEVARPLDLARSSGLVRTTIGTPGAVDAELSNPAAPPPRLDPGDRGHGRRRRRHRGPPVSPQPCSRGSSRPTMCSGRAGRGPRPTPCPPAAAAALPGRTAHPGSDQPGRHREPDRPGAGAGPRRWRPGRHRLRPAVGAFTCRSEVADAVDRGQLVPGALHPARRAHRGGSGGAAPALRHRRRVRHFLDSTRRPSR